jgi:diaminopimelate epimerase
LDIDFYKYHGTGNDFILIDNRNLAFPVSQVFIEKLCDRRFGIGADGLILLQEHPEYDFNMRYFNSDGNEASMCGNGGRCVVAFAEKLGLIQNHTTFKAYDGLHKASINNDLIELSMSDVSEISRIDEIFLLDTGSPQAVFFVTDLENTDVHNIGKRIRNNKEISKLGVNVNFVEIKSESEIDIRTYERGVEAETWSCGTGSVASAIISYKQNNINHSPHTMTVNVKGGQLKVSFELIDGNSFANIWLIGPASFVFSGKISF